MNRRLRSGSATFSGGSTLRATTRSRRMSRAFHTTPIPPSPSLSRISKWPIVFPIIYLGLNDDNGFDRRLLRLNRELVPDNRGRFGPKPGWSMAVATGRTGLLVNAHVIGEWCGSHLVVTSPSR